MLVYNILIGMTLLYIVFNYRVNFKKKLCLPVSFKIKSKEINTDTFALIILFIYYFVIYSFRNYTVGIDLKNYLIRYYAFAATPFKDIFKLADSFSFEYGYAVFIKLLTYISGSGLFFMIVTGLIISLGSFWFIKKHSKDPVFSFLIFFTFSMGIGAMNVVRQYLAIVILFASIQFLEKHKPIPFIVLVLLATTIHTGSIVFILLYPLLKITKIDWRYLLVALAGIIVFALFGDKIMYPIIEKTSFAWYIGRSGSGEEMLIFLVAVTLVMFFFTKESDELEERQKIWFDMMLLCFVFNAAALHLGLFERVMRFFNPALIVLIPNTLNTENGVPKKKLKFTVKILFILFFIAYFCYITYYGNGRNSGGAYPYEFMNITTFNDKCMELYNVWYG